MYNCIRCLAETDNDCDICDDCLSESKNDEMYITLRARIEKLEKALKFYHCGCAEGACVVKRPKFKGIRCGLTARKALEGKDD